MTGVVPPGPSWGQRQEPHGGHGAGAAPGPRGGEAQVSERQDEKDLQEERDCTGKAPGLGSGVFSPSTIT